MPSMVSYRAAGASLGWFAVLAQYWLSTSELGLAAGTIRYFGFFTLLGNILVAVAFAAPLISKTSFFGRSGVRTAIAVYILVVGVIFFVLLRKLYHPTGLGWYVNILLHYVMPPAYVLDWIMFVPKRELRFAQIPYWLIFPLCYAGYTLLHGAVSGYYPYPFLDAGKFGYGQISRNILGLTMFFIIVSVGFVVAARIGRKGAK